MNKDAAKSARTDTGAAPVIVDLRDRIPMMSDPDLVTLAANARRLLDAGSKIQRATAEDLIPAIEAEVADRKAKKRASQPAKKAAASKKKKKADADAEPEAEVEELG